MKKEVLFMALALLFVPAISLAQNVVDSAKVDPYEDMIVEIYDNEDGVEVRDTIYLNNPAEALVKVEQVSLKDCESVVVCDYDKYAIITKDGKKGVFDMILNKLVSDIEYDELGFSCRRQTGNNASISIFYTKKNGKEGMLSISD